jgi:hypothetical protein
MRALAAILSCCLTVPQMAMAADQRHAVPTAVAHYYAAGLELPLLELRRGAMLLDACAERLKRACSRQQRTLAADSRTLTLLDELTLFPQRPADDVASGVTKARELKERIAATSDALWREAIAYDRLLLARYGATLRACPNEAAAAQRASLEELIRLDLTGFQALAGDELARATDEIARNELAIATDLQRGPADDCAAARDLGEYLMQLMFAKLQRWSGEDALVANESPSFDFRQPVKPKVMDPPTLDVSRAIAGNFVSVVATELQISAHPESESRIKAIADEIAARNAFQ